MAWLISYTSFRRSVEVKVSPSHLLTWSNQACSAALKGSLFALMVCPFDSIRSVILSLMFITLSARGLSKISVNDIKQAMQVSENNPMVGIEGRAQLLVRLGTVLSDPSKAKYFVPAEGEDGEGLARPGNMVDYIRAHPTSTITPSASSLPVSAPLETLWELLIHGLGGVWPATRTKLEGVALGDVWPCESLRKTVSTDKEALVAFHKLTQWLK
jgi:hypothetical protein